MPIDPNIALSIRPIEQPNMLAQMGQVMQLRQLKDEYESNNALKDFYAQGGDLSKTEDQRRLMSTVGARGADLIAKQAALEKTKAEVKKIGYDNVDSEFKQSRNLLTSIDPNSPNAPAQLMAWHESNHKNPVLGPILSASGIDAASSRASIQAAAAKGPAAVQELIRRASLGQADYQKELMQTERSRIAAAPGHRQASLAETKYNDQLKAGGDIVVTTVPNPETGEPMEIQARRDLRTGQLIPLEVARMPMSIQMSPNSATSSYQTSGGGGVNTPAAGGSPNTLATQVAPQGAPATSVNELRPQATTFAQPKPSAPTLTEIANPDNPMESLRVDARAYKGGGVGSPGVLGVVKTGNLNPAQQQKLKGEISKDYKAIERVVGQTNELLESIDAVKSSNLDKVAGPITGRTFTLSNEGKTAETRFENLKGKVTAIAKANASLGGAIGSIANQEWQILANQLAVLDLKNGKDPTLEQIDQLERQAMSIVSRMQDGFQRQYGGEIETLTPQYKDVPNVNYTPGQYTATGKKTPKDAVDSKNKFLQ